MSNILFNRKPILDYVEEIKSFALVFSQALSESLELNTPNDLMEAMGGNDMEVNLHIHYYPPCPDPSLTMGFSEHSDVTSITIHLQDEQVGGLHIRKGDRWIAVNAVPDSLTINVGDQLEVSNMYNTHS